MTLCVSVTPRVSEMVAVHCVSAVLEKIGYHEHEKEEVSLEEPVFRDVLTGKRFSVISVEMVSNVGLVWCHSVWKDLSPVVLVSVPNSHH